MCVVGHHFVSQWHEIDPVNANSWPEPFLYGSSSRWPGDVITAAFVGHLMAHLDLPVAAKQTVMQMFLPIYGELQERKLIRLFDDDWRPTVLPNPLKHIVTAKEARIYLQRVLQFYEGKIAASDIPAMPRYNERVGMAESSRFSKPAYMTLLARFSVLR